MELVNEVAFRRMDERLMEYLIEKSGNRTAAGHPSEDCQRSWHLSRGCQQDTEGV
jgi:hypothetical protein